MKKTILTLGVLLLFWGQTSTLHAQSTFTADLELIFRDTVRYYELEAFNDSAMVNFSVVNHGEDDIDTSGLILYGMPGLPPGWALIVQSEDGDLLPLPSGDTLNSRGVMFSQDGTFAADTTIQYCFYLMTNEDQDNFIFDPNQENDTICFYITYKKNDSLTSIPRLVKSEDLQISPNPATDFVNIPVKDLQHGHGLLKVSGVDGRLMHEQNLDRYLSESVRLEIAAWPKGIYIVELQTEKSKRTGRFVVR